MEPGKELKRMGENIGRESIRIRFSKTKKKLFFSFFKKENFQY